MRTIIGLDPGANTGIVVAAVNMGKQRSFEILERATVRQANTGMQVVLRHKPDIVVVEQPAKFSIGKEHVYPVYANFLIFLTSAQVFYVTVRPTSWKPIAKANKWRKPKGCTKHEGDALNLIRYWLWREQKDLARLAQEHDAQQRVEQILKEQKK